MGKTKTWGSRADNELRVLLYDLETSPNIVLTWGIYEQNAIKVLVHRQIISVAWKWLGEREVHVKALPDFPGYRRPRGIQDLLRPQDNRALIRHLHGLFKDADVTVGHGVEHFDDRRSNTDMFKLGFTPPPPHRRVDTLKFARSKFDFNSNKLGDLGELLGLGKKVEHPGFPMWEGCMMGDPASWALMKKYNKGDVVLLEKVYLKMRPWMTLHPLMNTADGLTCPKCCSKRLVVNKRRMTRTGPKKQFVCGDCGGYCTVALSKGGSKSAIRTIERFV